MALSYCGKPVSVPQYEVSGESITVCPICALLRLESLKDLQDG